MTPSDLLRVARAAVAARVAGGESSPGSTRAVARLLSWAENAATQHDVNELLAGSPPPRTATQVIGLTGAPGVGKSTTTSAVIEEYRRRGLRVAVLAVDPSSPFSGGALLGDRIRLQRHALDPGVFIRSMATRGHLGGLSPGAFRAVHVLAAVGFEIVLVETVGVGQSEVEVSTLVDTTVVLIAPGTGDAVQSAKAGILEIGDVFVVNKADRDGADQMVRELQSMIRLGGPSPWRPEVLPCVATSGAGIAALLEAIDRHREHLLAAADESSSPPSRGRVET